MRFQGTQRILILILNEQKACKKSKKTVFVYFDGSFSDIFSQIFTSTEMIVVHTE